MELIIKATSVADLKEQIASLNSIMQGSFVGGATANLAPAKTTATTAVVYEIEPEEKSQKPKKSKEKKETVAEVADSSPAVEAAVSSEKVLDFKSLQETLQRLATKKGLGECSKLLSKFKVRVLKELPPTQYQPFQQACLESLG